MAVYDLMLKLEGLKALCGGGITDDEISFNLFPAHGTADQRSNLIPAIGLIKVNFTRLDRERGAPLPTRPCCA